MRQSFYKMIDVIKNCIVGFWQFHWKILVVSSLFAMTALGANAQNRSFDFTTGDTVTLNNAAGALSNRTTFTIEFWAKFTSVSGTINLVDITGGNDAGGLILNSGKLTVDLACDFGCLTESNALSLSAGTWYHIAVVFDNGTWDFYVDGVAQGIDVLDQSAINVVPDYSGLSVTNLLFGLQNHSSVDDFVGSIDDIRLWSSARTQTQIQNNRSIELVGNESGLLGYWKLNETSGTTVNDSQTNTTLLTGTSSGIAFNPSGAFTLNTTPTTSSLNGDSVAWAGVGSTVSLDASGNANLADTELDALNSGNGNWADATLTVQRSGTAITSDTFGFNTSGALFTVSGSNLQSGGLTFATFANTNGVLTITFTSSGTTATSALVDNLAQRITYRSDNPAGDATVSFVLTDGDGGTATTANVTVTSDSIYVTNTTDTSTIDITNGVSFSEAVAIAAADATGSQTIFFASAIASTALTINTVSLNESLTFDMDSASGMSLTSGTITLGAATTQTFTNGTGDTAAISGAIGGSGALTKSGSGGLTLSGTNSYTGTTTVSAGTLTVSNGNAISNSGNVSVSSGATFALSSNESVGNLSGAGSITLGSNTLTTTLTADNTFSGGISGTGSLNVNQTGAATFALTLSGTNTYTGGSTLQNYGWLKLDGDAAFSSSAQLRVNGNSKLTLLTDQTVGSISTASVATAGIDLGAFTLTAGADNSTTTVSTVISGTGSLVKQGSGVMTVDGTNTYSGTTTVSAGTLSVSSDSNLGANSVTLASGSTLEVTGATNIDNSIVLGGNSTVNIAAATTFSGVVSGASGLTKTGGSTLTLSNTNTYSGSTTISNGSISIASDANMGTGSVVLNGGSLILSSTVVLDNAITLATGTTSTVQANGNSILYGDISGSGNLTKTGSLTLQFLGNNSYTGTTSITSGIVLVDNNNSLGTSAGGTSVSSGATLLIASGVTLADDLTLAGSTGNGAIYAMTGSSLLTGAITLASNTLIHVDTGISLTLSGGISDGSGTYNLIKDSAGTLVLSGSANYDGTSTLNAGTLSIAADSNLGAGSLVLDASTVLAVTGATTIDNAIVLAGSATVNTSAVTTLSGNITGSNGFTKSGNSVLTLSGTDSYTGSTLVNAGTMRVNGALSATSGVTVASGATLGGSGSIFASSSSNTLTVQNGGALSPGNSSGILTINGNLDMDSGSTLAVEINGSVAGTQYDQVIVNGGVDVTSATLSATHSYTPGSGDIYTIIVNDLADTVTGTFSGLAEGATLTAGGNSTELTASYIGGTGNDFTLTAPIPPAVNSVSASSSNGTYKIGDAINLTVTFDTAVTVDTTGGTPSLTLETGTTDRTATYVSGSGSTTLSFSYTIQAGDLSSDLDYVSTSALALNGGTIQDSGNSNDAVLTLASPGAANSLGANKALVVDGVRPTAGLVVADTALAVGETSLVTITFSESVSNLTSTDLTVANGVVSSLSTGDGGITWTATLTPTVSTTSATNLITLDNTGITDAAGNTGTGTTDSNNYAIDTTIPNAVSGFVAIASGSTVGLSWTNPATDFASVTIRRSTTAYPVSIASDTSVLSNSTLTSFNDTGLVDGTYYYSIFVTDVSGNVSVAATASVVVDTLGISNPTIVVADTNLIAGETSLATITFSESVLGLAIGDFTVANGVLSSLSSGDGGITWTATLTPNASVTDATNVITLANTGVADAAGNTGTGTTDSNNYAIDTLRPTATILVTTTGLIEGDTSAVIVTFNEAVTGFTNADLTIENATLSAVTSGDGGITWTATLTAAVGVNDSTNVITLANTGVTDAVGNTGTGTTASNNYTVNMANSAPILSSLNGGSTYIENGTAVVIDTDVSVSDADFDVLNSGNGNYSGASLVVVRSGGAVSSDIIGFTNGNGINQIGNSLIKNGLVIANINSGVQGQWTITFTDANTEIPTRSDVVAVLRQLTYSSSNNDPATSVNLGLVLSDGIVTAPGVAAVTITTVNDAPSLTATAASPTFTEGGSAVNLFSGSAVSTVEAGQLITELQLTVTNLANGADESISIDGSNLALTNGNSATTATNAMTANVSVSGSTAAVVLTKPAGISTAAAQTLVNGISYRNTSEAVTNSGRTVTLSRLVDNGGTADGGVDTATVSIASVVTMTAVNDGPVISGAPATSVNQDAAYNFVPATSDLDGDVLVFSILNKPTWASFNTATGALIGTPVNADVGVTNGIVISVSDGTASVSLPTFNLTVVNVNDAPVISGTPTASVNEDSAYSFTPTASDVDTGTTLVYSITNQPSWASFSTTTGSLTGIPTNADVGVTTGIVISVSDGTMSSSLAGFNLTVVNTNDAPVISGTPSTSVDQDVAYSFVPTASDVDTGTTLTYSITNKPAWASFNTATGALTGTPAYANAGVYSGIVISVSDGQLSTALPAFNITVIQGQNPDEPVLTVPGDLTLNATALYTPVTLRQLLGLAANSTQAQIDAAVNALAASASGNNCCTTAPEGLNTNNALLLSPGRHEVRWVSRNNAGVTDEDIQVINIKPLVNFSKPQMAARNSQVEFRILLNGPSPVYPFEVAYQIDNSTTAAGNEHNLVAGIAQFTADNPLEAVIPVTINPLTGIGNRELVVAFADSQLNAGAANRHIISIREGNLPPVVKLVLTQGGIETSQITPNGGAVTVTAQVTDFNATDTHSFDWSATTGLADTDGNPTNAVRVFNPAGLTGAHRVVVTVADSANARVQADLSFKVVASLPTLTNEDTDGDGESDLTEGADDSDSNGIPDYLDNMPSSNVLPQVGLITDSYLIECDPGVRCGLGLLALTGSSGGVQILDNEMGTLGNLVKDDKFIPAGGIFDFVIRDLPTPGQTVRVVIPQQAAIPANAVYRKFQQGRWVNFVEDAKNTLHSAAGNAGYCPPPGAAEWRSGLTAGHLCVQLGIEDGGANDEDGLVNAAVSDPGAVSSPEPVIAIETKGKGGSVSLWFLLILAVLLSIPKRKAGLLLLVGMIGLAGNTQARSTQNASVRVDVYQAQSDPQMSDLQAAIDTAGFDAQVTEFSVEKTAYAFSLGYQWNELSYTQIGYMDMGEVEVNLILDAAEDRAAFAKALEKSYPVSASGFTLVQGLTMYPYQQLTLSTEAGLFIWDGDIDVAGDQLNLDYKRQTDLLVGFRLDYALMSQISLGISLQHLAFDRDGVDLFGVSARYQF